MADQNHDGFHIKGLLINFLDRTHPPLLKLPEFLVDFVTPIVRVAKGKRKIDFLTLPEYGQWMENAQGLGTSTDADARGYSRMKKHMIPLATAQGSGKELIDLAFSKKKAGDRNELLRQFKAGRLPNTLPKYSQLPLLQPGTCLDHNLEEIPYSEPINKELILFSMADNICSIPSAADGLKPGQRKVIWACFKRKMRKEIKEGGHRSHFNDGTVHALPLRTFSSHSSSRAAQSVLDAIFTSKALPTPSLVFKRALSPLAHRRQQSFLSKMADVDMQADSANDNVLIPPSTHRILGMGGTIAGSGVSAYTVELDASDPDSDIPDELQSILFNQSDNGDVMSYRYVDQDDLDASFAGSTPGSEAPGPPVLDLPTFRAQLFGEEENRADISADMDAISSDEDGAKKPFDFTGEIKKLHETGGSDRHSFVEQMENAFRTPAKINLRYGFPSSLLSAEIPLVPKLPAHLSSKLRRAAVRLSTVTPDPAS
ncbi:hypothetical protein DXG01_002005 [Tephrocybe rancida]|nr:hypothetical protein DXG01_002005 [Tephrocybe rancida]